MSQHIIQTTEKEQEIIQITELRPEHISESAHLLTKTFMIMNPIWKSQKFNYDELYEFMKKKCQLALNQVNKYHNFSMSWVVLRNGKVVAVSTNFELTNFIKHLDHKPIGDMSIYGYLNDLSLQFWKTYDISNLKEGQAFYGDFLGVNPEDKDKGYTIMLTKRMLQESIAKGMKYNLSRISNGKLVDLMVKKLKSQIVKEYSFEHRDKTHKFWMIKTDMDLHRRLMGIKKSKL